MLNPVYKDITGGRSEEEEEELIIYENFNISMDIYVIVDGSRGSEMLIILRKVN
jgi:hypothetical protein